MMQTSYAPVQGSLLLQAQKYGGYLNWQKPIGLSFDIRLSKGAKAA
ncbi:hypothetical protein DB29_00474 [Shouchella clausii]|nr:hypothetical protein DB29_00474 [Shouchella clausii]